MKKHLLFAALAWVLGSGTAVRADGAKARWSVYIDAPPLVIGAGSAAPVYLVPAQPVYMTPVVPVYPAYRHGPPAYYRPVAPRAPVYRAPPPRHAPPVWQQRPPVYHGAPPAGRPGGYYRHHGHNGHGGYPAGHAPPPARPDYRQHR